jgi:hypothetical protein
MGNVREQEVLFIDGFVEQVLDCGVTKSSENANDDHYKTSYRGLGISVIDVAMDWGGFEPPTS